MRPKFFIWTGGQPADPEDGPRVGALPPLPDPEPLPRGARIIYWWGNTRFELLAAACSVRTTPWGAERMTWLHCKAAWANEVKPDGAAGTRNMLIPAHYVTALKPGPTYRVDSRLPSVEICLFPPNRPAPPHGLPLAAIERALAELPEWPDTAGWNFSVSYPIFALRRQSGDYLGYGAGGVERAGTGTGVPVFTTEAWAAEFLRRSDPSARVVAFDRAGAFRRFLRSIGDAGTFVLFDPVPGRDNVLYADHAYPAAVVLGQFLPEGAFVWGYPVYVLRLAPGFACITGDHAGTPVKLLVAFTDSDLADRAAAATSTILPVVPVPDAQAFARLVRDLSADVEGVAFDPPDPVLGGVAKFVIFRDKLLDLLADSLE